MELEWMGRYRNLVRTLIHYSNTTNRSIGGTFDPVENISLTKYEYQILEHICEHENDNHIMADITRWTGINPSNVTKATKKLTDSGLVKRYRFKDNKKNIVLKPTELGKKVYTGIYMRDVYPVFKPFFDSLDSFSDDELNKMDKAIGLLTNDWDDFVGDLLIEEAPN